MKFSRYRKLLIALAAFALLSGFTVWAQRVLRENSAVSAFRKFKQDVEQLEQRQATELEVQAILGPPRNAERTDRGHVWYYSFRGPGGRIEITIFLAFDLESGRLVRSGSIVHS